MKTALRQGTAKDLNIYSANPVHKDPRKSILGWGTFPEWYNGNLINDGVVIKFSTFPGGSIAGKNKGVTAAHKVGHWLGLFHTFQGGCTAVGDSISDTLAELSGAKGCPKGHDTCTGPEYPGTNPIHNFLDYTDDACMDHFTAGQAVRMDNQWAAYRAGETKEPTKMPSTKSPQQCFKRQ
jgi:hypothetical protein